MGGFDDRYLAFAAGITCQRRGFCFRDLGVERGTSDKCSEDCFVLFFLLLIFFGGEVGVEDGGTVSSSLPPPLPTLLFVLVSYL